MENGLFDQGLAKAANKFKGWFHYAISYVELVEGKRVFSVNLLDVDFNVIKTIQIIIKGNEVTVDCAGEVI